MIALHDQSKSFADFKLKLNENGAPFPESVIENMDRLILSLHPKHKKSRSTIAKGDRSALADKDKNSRIFPGLSLPDQEWKPSPLKDIDGRNDPVNKEVDDLMAQLEGVSKRARPKAAEFMADDDRDRSPKRQKRDDISPPRRRRSLSPPSRRDNGYRDRYDDGTRGRSYGRRDMPLDDRPILYKIYTGKVNSLKDFGAFVTVEGVKGRVDGTCHLPKHDLNILSSLR